MTEEQQMKLRQDEIEERIDKLQQQALNSLQRPSADAYKDAINRYELILAYGRSTLGDRYSFFEEKLVEARQAYEEFQTLYGQLTTARQNEEVERELIEIRKLLAKGIHHDEVGNELAERQPELFEKLRESLLRTAKQLVAKAHTQLQEGIGVLDTNQIDSAFSKLDEAIQTLNGEKLNSFDNEQASQVALDYIRKTLVNPDLEKQINEYSHQRDEWNTRFMPIKQVCNLYAEAEGYFQQENYGEAVERLDHAMGQLPTDLRNEVNRVSSLRQSAQRRWENVTVPKAKGMLIETREKISQREYDSAWDEANQIIQLEPHLESTEVDKCKEEAFNILDEILAAKGEEFENKRIKKKEIAEMLINRAREHIDQNRYLQAIDALVQANRNDPENNQISKLGHEARSNVLIIINEQRKQEQDAQSVEDLCSRIDERLSLEENLAQLGEEFALPETREQREELNRLIKWNDGVKRAPELIEQAKGYSQAGEEAKSNSDWRTAGESFEKAAKQYKQAEKELQIPSLVKLRCMRMPPIQILSERTTPLVKEVKGSLPKCQKQAEDCQGNVRKVQQCLERAREILEKRELGQARFDEVRNLAEQAIGIDPSNEEAKRINRECEQRKSEDDIDDDLVRKVELVLKIFLVVIILIAFFLLVLLFIWM